MNPDETNASFQQFLMSVQDKIEQFKCPKCGNTVFEPKLVLGRLSPIYSPSGEEMVFPMGSITVCSKCGLILGEENNNPQENIEKPEEPKEPQNSTIISFDSFKKNK